MHTLSTSHQLILNITVPWILRRLVDSQADQRTSLVPRSVVIAMNLIELSQTYQCHCIKKTEVLPVRDVTIKRQSIVTAILCLCD